MKSLVTSTNHSACLNVYARSRKEYFLADLAVFSLLFLAITNMDSWLVGVYKSPLSPCHSPHLRCWTL